MLTGFYIQALLYDIDFKENEEGSAIRAELEALARSRAEEVRAFLLKHGPGLGKRVNIASKGGLPDVRSGTAQVEIQLR